MTTYLIRIMVCWVVAFGLLYWQYPWSTYYDNFRFSWQETVASYVIVATAMVAVGCLFSPLVTDKMLARGRSRSAFISIRIAIALAAFVLIAVLCGPYGFNVRGTRVRGIFFAEWKFMTFLFYCALPFAVAAAVAMPWSANGVAVMTEKPTSGPSGL